ncbi:hypothetical protein ETU09_04715 [Apibacter muscae]|uniref:Tyr recombinase domain-containing protein n=1 Tax=Apibacter muscae TaxID=2509004 RepID=A0A563DG89_9FLAO|nr:site-specific integrase [Apibacter muscae]TWP29147.1 hypothetical protein ETU09_04715 [Apibacter muscae]
MCDYEIGNVNDNVITMTTETKFGCYYTDIWVSPNDWKSSKKTNLYKEWYVQCYFYDPAFKEKYPKGFQFRKRANKPKTIEERQSLIKLLINTMREYLNAGFNPITKSFMGVNEVDQNLNKNTLFIDALEFALNKREDNSTKNDLKSVVKYTSIAITHLHLSHLKISEVERKHIKFILEYLQKNAIIERKGKLNKSTGKYKITYEKLSDKRNNKYKSYLSTLFKDIIEYDAIDFNPCRDIRKKPVIHELRSVLSHEERQIVNDHLFNNHYKFWLFMQIFFHSGGREIELLNVKAKDVEIENQKYKVLIKKGGGIYREEYRIIKNIALPFWKEALENASPEAYLFHRGLVPGISEKPIRPDQISRRWKTHVKDKFGIKADFYSLKHSNLDEISELLSVQDAAKMASHNSTRMVEKHYAVGLKERQLERLKNLNNQFV